MSSKIKKGGPGPSLFYLKNFPQLSFYSEPLMRMP